MFTRSYTFEEVSTKRTKTGKCEACGKRASRTEKFYQTISPFNKNDKGEVKNRDEIWDEILEEAQEWMKKPLYHVKCEP